MSIEVRCQSSKPPA